MHSHALYSYSNFSIKYMTFLSNSVCNSEVMSIIVSIEKRRRGLDPKAEQQGSRQGRIAGEDSRKEQQGRIAGH